MPTIMSFFAQSCHASLLLLVIKTGHGESYVTVTSFISSNNSLYVVKTFDLNITGSIAVPVGRKCVCGGGGMLINPG